MIDKRTNKYSSNKELFNLSKSIYNEAIKRSGYYKTIITLIRIIPQSKKVKIENENYCGSSYHIRQ